MMGDYLKTCKRDGEWVGRLLRIPDPSHELREKIRREWWSLPELRIYPARQCLFVCPASQMNTNRWPGEDLSVVDIVDTPGCRRDSVSRQGAFALSPAHRASLDLTQSGGLDKDSLALIA